MWAVDLYLSVQQDLGNGIYLWDPNLHRHPDLQHVNTLMSMSRIILAMKRNTCLLNVSRTEALRKREMIQFQNVQQAFGW